MKLTPEYWECFRGQARELLAVAQAAKDDQRKFIEAMPSDRFEGSNIPPLEREPWTEEEVQEEIEAVKDPR